MYINTELYKEAFFIIRDRYHLITMYGKDANSTILYSGSSIISFNGLSLSPSESRSDQRINPSD